MNSARVSFYNVSPQYVDEKTDGGVCAERPAGKHMRALEQLDTALREVAQARAACNDSGPSSRRKRSGPQSTLRK